MGMISGAPGLYFSLCLSTARMLDTCLCVFSLSLCRPPWYAAVGYMGPMGPWAPCTTQPNGRHGLVGPSQEILLGWDGTEGGVFDATVIISIYLMIIRPRPSSPK